MSTGKWKESLPTKVRNKSGVDVWVYFVPLHDQVDRRKLPVGLNYRRSAEECGADCPIETIGKYRDLYTCVASSFGPLWAVLLAPLEPESNEYGEISP